MAQLHYQSRMGLDVGFVLSDPLFYSGQSGLGIAQGELGFVGSHSSRADGLGQA